MTGFVYKWTNQINGKWYIGSRKGTIDDRYRHSSRIVKAAEKKYGIENFTREILFEGDYDQDKIRSIVEAKFLVEEDAANNLMSYNQTNITGNNCINEATRQKMRVAKLGVKRSKAVCAILSESHMGIKFTEERCRNISIAKTGVKRSKAARESISKGRTGCKYKQISCPHCKQVGGMNAMNRWHFDNCSRAPANKDKRRQQKSVTCPHCNKTGGVSGMYRYHFTNCKTLTT